MTFSHLSSTLAFHPGPGVGALCAICTFGMDPVVAMHGKEEASTVATAAAAAWKAADA